MNDIKMLPLLIMLACVCGLSSKSFVRTPYLVPIAKPPPPSISPTLTPTLPAAIIQKQFQAFVFPNQLTFTTPIPKRLTSTPNACPSTTPVISRSVPCSQPGLSKVDLSDDDLSYVLSDEGGSYVPQYMAVEEKEASRNFKNMLSLNAMYKDQGSAVHSLNWKWDYSLTKSKLIELLDKAHAEFYPTTTESSSQELTQLEIVWKHIFNRSLSPSYNQTAKSFNKPEPKQGRKRRHANGNNQNLQRNINIYSPMKDEVMIPKHIMDQIVPAQKLYTDNERVKRDSSGAVSRAEYCTARGNQTTDGYLHMCTTCSHTTTLSDDKFPRIINEAVCHHTERGCLFLSSTPHGSCHQNVMFMSMLRKKAGSCMMVIHNGAQVLTDEWEVYSQPIRVSCECRIDKRSPFAQYINPN